MEKELLQKCNLIAQNASIVARDEIRLFCQIMDWSDADVYFVADDPHGVVSLGDYFFNMSDIHEVVANYPKLLERFGSNEELSNIIIRWYDWTLEYHSKHPVMDWQKVDLVNKFTGEKTKVLPIEECDYNGDRKFVLILFEDRVVGREYMPKMASYSEQKDDWRLVDWTWLKDSYGDTVEVTHWFNLNNPTDEHYINLHSWLMGACELVEKGE